MKCTKVRTCYGCQYYYLSKEEYEKGRRQKSRHCNYLCSLDCPRREGYIDDIEDMRGDTDASN